MLSHVKTTELGLQSTEAGPRFEGVSAFVRNSYHFAVSVSVSIRMDLQVVVEEFQWSYKSYVRLR